MSGYKDFTAYNEACEEIRPTARIQLIQRILNAASLISSLGQGVPLRWANAYKSFQVLVPNENSAPTDYTTAEAISSCDSILHEAESQLRAAQDDLNTLRTELASISDMHVTCNPVKADIDNFKDIDYDGNDYYISLLAQIPDTSLGNGMFCVHYNAATGEVEWAWIKEADWYNIPVDHRLGALDWLTYYTQDSNFSMFTCNTSTNDMFHRMGTFRYTDKDNQRQLLLVDLMRFSDSILICVHNTETTGSRRVSGYKVVSRTSNTFSSITPRREYGVDIYFGSFSSTVANYVPLNGVLAHEFTANGKAPNAEYLGLPDPSAVIDILDDM